MGLTNLPGLGTILVGVTCVLSFIAFVLHAVAFATRDWLVSVEPSPFVKFGWHRACFNQCRSPYCPGGEQLIYDGCWWIYDYYFETLRQQGWLLPDWYIQVRWLVILNVPLVFIAFMLAAFAMGVVSMWRYPRPKTPRRDGCLNGLMIAAIILFFSTGVMMLVGLGVYAMNCFSYNWMPMPHKNRLGYSFWLEASSCVTLLLCVVTGTSAVVLKWVGSNSPKAAHVAEDMMMGMDTFRPELSTVTQGKRGRPGVSGPPAVIGQMRPSGPPPPIPTK